MKELFVPYELAVKLKEKGFKEECICGYNSFKLLTSKVSYSTGNDCECRWDDRYDTDVRAPLYQQVIDWFRKKYIKIVEIDIFISAIQWKVKEAGSRGNSFGSLNEAIEEALKLI